MSLIWILVVLFVILGAGGGYLGYSRGGYAGGPRFGGNNLLFIVIVIAAVLLLFGGVGFYGRAWY
jgi:uncharacterized membrane protein